jgi:predicted O-methyltransferase YrrM
MCIKILLGVTIFLSAYLIFQIEPLSGKIVTARLGGSAGIWSVCVLFFQLVVLAGYVLTYLLCKLKPKLQATLYATLAVASLGLLKLPPPELWMPPPELEPVYSLLSLLIGNLAVPCIFLSSVSGMLQKWFAQLKLGNPYPLYSISNTGSLGALLAYPILVEPHVGLAQTIDIWRWFYVAVIGLVVLSAVIVWLIVKPEPAAVELGVDEAAPSSTSFLVWLCLSALGSVTLLVYTTYLTQDIAPVPLLWVVPLSIYLVTFILCFAASQFYERKILLLLAPALLIFEPCLRSLPAANVLAVLSIIFLICMICHGELVLRKPGYRYLPLFYLAVALGGALGGILVNLVAPSIFDSYVERGIIGWCIIALTVKSFWKDDLRFFSHRWLDAAAIITLVYLLALLNLTFLLKPGKVTVWQKRNFYGCLSVNSDGDRITLVNGDIIHGSQYKDKAFQFIPTQYYARSSGAGLIDDCWRSRHPGRRLKYGLIGLGAGTMAAYANPGDTVVFYEIDPKVKEAAQRYFSYLSNCRGSVTILNGDARVTLSTQAPQNFDYLLVDAFNGDAVPVHLLTKEAVNIYLKHLAADGILLVHISNKYVNLEPVLANIAEQLGLTAQYIRSPNGRYVAISRMHPVELPAEDQKFFPELTIEQARGNQLVGVWTDNYSNVYAILNRK